MEWSSSDEESSEREDFVNDTPDHHSSAHQCDQSNFFAIRHYTSKEDIINAVLEFNTMYGRAFRVAESNCRRYKAVCCVPTCDFVVQFAFLHEFKAPSKFKGHTCSVMEIDYGTRVSNRSNHAKQIARNTNVRDLFSTHGRFVSARMIRSVMKKAGFDPTYKNCLNAKTRLLVEFFGRELEQYAYLPWYLDQLKSRVHICAIEVADGVFQRLAIVYREGAQAFAPYAARGLVVDGTFLKTSAGSMLLVVCFRNGNNELQIVAIGVVSIENESNWPWFVEFPLSNLPTVPAFVVSDRDKGLLPAMRRVCPFIPHLFCFRHIMENFNRKFKSKLLKKLAWRFARSTSDSGFDAALKHVSFMNQEASQWLLDIGSERWSLLHSSIPRFGVLTSNHVESINGALRGFRSLPVLDCLIAIERYI